MIEEEKRKRYDDFVQELKELLLKHRLWLGVLGEDHMAVWDNQGSTIAVIDPIENQLGE